MGEPLPVKAFSHLCIGITDMERSLQFYRDLLGMDVVFDVELEGGSLEAVTGDTGAKGRMVGGLIGGTMVELLEFHHRQTGGRGRATAGPRLGYTNMSVSVDDLDAAYEQVQAAGITPEQKPVEIAGVRMFFVKDPDGTPIEIVEFPGGLRNSAELWRGASSP